LALAIFDLDNTLLSGDSDYLWGQFLAQTGAVDRAMYEQENLYFFHEYKKGTLDIMEFQRFSLRPLAQHSVKRLQRWRDQFLREKIEPIILPPATQLVEQHRRAGDILVIITATNSFVTAPIARRFGIEHLIATDPAMSNGRYTGEVMGIPCFKEGKVRRLKQWLEDHGETLQGSSFYSDSHNDIPLLEQVDKPVAVDPDDKLKVHARARGWPVISLHPPQPARSR